MKKLVLLTFLLFHSYLSPAQNHPACDSLVIQCCTFDSLGPNTLTIYATNYSSYLFDYPGFLIMNATMDTIMALETVNYFGIGASPQPHTMDIISSINLPFNGYLQLYTGFYDSLRCTFPFTIPDTLSTNISESESKKNMFVYPNPSGGKFNLDFGSTNTDKFLFVSIWNAMGEEIYSKQLESSSAGLSIHNIPAGIYFIKIADAKNRFLRTEKLIIQ
jgi:hypothetical protein